MKKIVLSVLSLGFFCSGIIADHKHHKDKTGVVYDEVKARQGVQKMKSKINYMYDSIKYYIDKKEEIPQQVYEKMRNKYLKMPTTWNINWDLIGGVKDTYKKVDAIQGWLNDHIEQKGINSIPMPKLFNPR